MKRPEPWIAGALGIILAYELLRLIPALPPSGGLADQVAQRLPESGLDWPVTAVLLNFRGYDTLLEIAVLLLALQGVLTLPPREGMAHREGERPNPLLENLVRLLAPIMVVISGYLLWVGASGPGGAFQAGAVLAAAGVLLQLSGRVKDVLLGRRERSVLMAGLFLFLLLAALGPLQGRPMLTYGPGLAKPLLLMLEAALTLSIGAILWALFGASSSSSGTEEGP